jgi:ABC-2 type transport system ATP-binding protein
MPVIQARDLRKRYGHHVAVDGLSLDVSPGETFGLLGPNGAGKTTTMHLLAGVLRPDSGSVTIDGQPDPTRPAVRRRLGMAPQALALYGQLNPVENLTFFGRLAGLGGAGLKQRVGWALDLAGLADRRRDRVATFSGGMMRRLNLACALVHDPAVLLLDEATAGVDPQSRNHLLDTVAGLARQGRTILYTTHYVEEAQRLCDRVAVIDHGKLLALDTVDGLLSRYGGRPVVEVELEREPEDPGRLPGKLAGRRLRLETDRPLDELLELRSAGAAVASFRVDRPDLESVFLTLTGRRLRD